MSARSVLIGTGWVVACLVLFGNPVGFWPLGIYLGFFSFFLTVVDEGHEARKMTAELRQLLR